MSQKLKWISSRLPVVPAIGVIVLHVRCAGSHGADFALSTLLIVMSIVCGVCVFHIIKNPSKKEFASMLCMSSLMIGVHLLVVVAPEGYLHGCGVVTTYVGSQAGGSELDVALIIGLELIVAGMCAHGLKSIRKEKLGRT